ncbi:copper homeostasis protein CutC [Amycolatopsis suaedae]|uniref:Copper homeostasis protein cutC homolog n=1 Tax=Amycolatopsis suaedae TaxID=2510978 RepID=A0A4Q7J6F3_9PSEU|nr:copper homeostasis protein CutC [Amycolatopsis suaedae]
MLEVIALGAHDAERAQEGGADRLELVADMAADGLTPPAGVVREVLSATDLPVRVMLRDTAGFAPADLDALRRTAGELLAVGAREFVLGFLTPHGAVDAEACRAVLAELGGARWTFHRALDHAADPVAAWGVAAGLGCDTVLTAGHPGGVDQGLDVLHRLADLDGPPELLVGGGLREEHLPVLRAAGVRAFHVGGAVRPGGWAEPVDAAAVRRWSDLVNGLGAVTPAPA